MTRNQVADERRAKPRATDATAPRDANTVTERKVSILLVDDDPHKRSALAAALDGLDDLNLLTAGSSEEALGLVLKHDYAVLLLDVMLPDMNGFELARLIRSRPRSRHTPIIFITAYSHEDLDPLRGYSLGAVDYIFAPVIPEVLRAKVRVFIELAMMRAGLEREIAERRRQQEAITSLNEELAMRAAQLEAANRELESFSYSVSHDLRAPVRAINGFSRVLEEEFGDRLDEEGRRLLRIVIEQGRVMGQLIDDLLEFSRLGRQALAAHDIDMTALANAALREAQDGHSAAAAVRIRPLARATGDPALIMQVWINLLSNAIKFSGKRERPEIEVGCQPRGAHNVFYVKDNGAGFDMQYYEKLFGVFHRLHSAEEFPGTGVGLALVHRIVTRHGGQVWAQGKVGEGATFYFTLKPGQGDG